VRKFDVRKRVKITTYARHRIRGAMLDSLRTLDDASRDLRQKKKKVEVVCRELEARFGRPPSDSEVAAELGLSLDGWYRTLHEISALGVDWLRSGRSGNEKVAFGESPDGEDSEDPFRRCFLSEQREILQRALAELPERQRLVVLLYTEHGLTMNQIAARLKVGESRVSQIYSAARASLRKRVQGILRQPRHGPPSTIGTTFATGL
jgi:RNA polymerase sigma factor for flagellar operon FliA